MIETKVYNLDSLPGVRGHTIFIDPTRIEFAYQVKNVWQRYNVCWSQIWEEVIL